MVCLLWVQATTNPNKYRVPADAAFSSENPELWAFLLIAYAVGRIASESVNILYNTLSVFSRLYARVLSTALHPAHIQFTYFDASECHMKNLLKRSFPLHWESLPGKVEARRSNNDGSLSHQMSHNNEAKSSPHNLTRKEQPESHCAEHLIYTYI